MSNDDLEPEHSRADNVLLNTPLVRPYAIAGVTYVPAVRGRQAVPVPVRLLQVGGASMRWRQCPARNRLRDVIPAEPADVKWVRCSMRHRHRGAFHVADFPRLGIVAVWRRSH